MKRALTVKNMLQKKFTRMEFTGPWAASFGQPELSGSWIIWGDSGNGKTRFTLQLAKYLSSFAPTAYNSLEEGSRLSMRIALEQTHMIDVNASFLLLEKEDHEALRERFSKRRSPKIIITDSIQYSGLDVKAYKQLISDFPDKLFVFVSHADGDRPKGTLAQSVRYDADVKIFVKGFKAHITSRLGGGKDFIIWEEGAKKYWGDVLQI